MGIADQLVPGEGSFGVVTQPLRQERKVVTQPSKLPEGGFGAVAQPGPHPTLGYVSLAHFDALVRRVEVLEAAVGGEEPKPKRDRAEYFRKRRAEAKAT